jgi:hypothetical protein
MFKAILNQGKLKANKPSLLIDFALIHIKSHQVRIKVTLSFPDARTGRRLALRRLAFRIAPGRQLHGDDRVGRVVRRGLQDILEADVGGAGDIV